MTHKMLKVKPSALLFDHTYQRPPVKSHVARLVANFDPTLMGALIVSRREGGDYVVDGQHRAIAAVEAGRGDIATDAVVHLGLTRAEEAELFLRLNRERKPVTRSTEWGAALVAREPAVVMQAEAIARAGWRVTPGGTTNGALSAVTALARLRKLDPGGELDLTFRTLSVLTQAWGKGKETVNGNLIEGVALFLHRFGDQIDGEALAGKLRGFGDPQMIIGEARAHRTTLGGSLANAVGFRVHKLWNSGRTSRRLPGWI